ncbi:MAG: ribosome-associated translation inhibitor RaiA, partial [Patescibacteria group bacterium]
MRIDIKGTQLDLTPSLKVYIEEKLSVLNRFIARFERNGERVLFFEIARATKHHRHGNVFYAEAMVKLPGRTIRIEEYDSDARTAGDRLKNRLKSDLKKYKEKRIARVERKKRNHSAGAAST